MKIGYARVSTAEQKLNLQTDALGKASCEKIFSDTASGAKNDRKGLLDAVEFCRAGDSLVVWKLDRLGRSLKHLIETINLLHKKKVGFVSVQESIDTTTLGGKLIFHVFGALAEFEREIIRERTRAGLASARARGRLGGRPPSLNKKQSRWQKNCSPTRTTMSGIFANSSRFPDQLFIEYANQYILKYKSFLKILCKFL